MPTYDTDVMTGNSAKAIHAGLNVQICTWTGAETASGSTTIRLCALPAGAEVVDVTLYGANTMGTGGELFSVYSTIGGSEVQRYIGSAAGAAIVRANTAGGPARLTASAVCYMQPTNLGATGTSTFTVRAAVSYLAEKRGD